MKKIIAAIVLLTVTLFAFGDNIPSGVLNVGKQAVAGVIRVYNGGSVKLRETNANGSDEITFKSPDSLTAAYTFTLPNGMGSNGQVLSTNGTSTTSWASAATVPSAGIVYSNGTSLASSSFSAANKLVGVNSSNDGLEAKSATITTTGALTLPGGLVGQNIDGGVSSATSGTVSITKYVTSFTTTALTGTLNADLPTTDVKSGQIYCVYLKQITTPSETNLLVLRSSGGNTIDTIAKGYICAKALVDTPTTAGNWDVTDVDEIYVFTSAWTFNNGGTIASQTSARIWRNNLGIVFQGAAASGTPTSASNLLTADSAIPSRFRPIASNVVTAAIARDNGANLTTPGIYRVTSGGVIEFYTNANAITNGGNLNFSANANTGLTSNPSLSYTKQ